MDERLIEVRRRLRDDFAFYSANALQIRTKDGDVRPLVLKPAQRLLLDAVNKQQNAGLPVRIIVLKARQQGLSTVIGGLLYFWLSQRAAQRGIVVTHKAESTRALFDMTKRYHSGVPEMLRPSTKYSSRKELFFDVLDSSFIVATAGGDAIARGETITHAHLSELAFWPASSARENFNGLAQAIPERPGTSVFIESTANGVSGLFYETWKGAVEGTNSYVAVFIPWFLDPEYQKEPGPNFERTADEIALAELAIREWDITISDAQLQFRRKKIGDNGIDLFRQEYPATPDEAFLTTGRPVFNPEQLQKRLSEMRANEDWRVAVSTGARGAVTYCLQRLALEGEEFKEHPRGELLLYRPYSPTEAYTIGADVAMGVRDGDYSVAQVLDSKKRQVATWRARVHPDYFAEVLFRLGHFFNMAMIAPEANNHGILTVNRLFKDLAYPYVYQDTIHEQTVDKETARIGFSTTVKTKPLVIDKLRAALRDGDVELNDDATVRELLTYIVTENGSMEAEQGCHDDCVMALAIANHVHEGSFQPIANRDDWFIEVL